MINEPTNDPPIWLSQSAQAESAANGDCFTVFAPFSDAYLVGFLLDVSGDEALLAPISAETRFAGDWDLILESDVLGYRAMVELWNVRVVLREQLRENISSIGESDFVSDSYDRLLSGRALQADVPQGPEIFARQDPRVGFRELETDRAAAYAQPAATLAAGESLGEILKSARESRGLTIAEIADHTELSVPAVGRIENDGEDIRANVSMKSFEKLLNRLVVPPAPRLVDRIAVAIESNTGDAQYAAGPLHARTRRGFRKAAGPAPVSGDALTPQAWAEKLRNSMLGEM